MEIREPPGYTRVRPRRRVRCSVSAESLKALRQGGAAARSSRPPRPILGGAGGARAQPPSPQRAPPLQRIGLWHASWRASRGRASAACSQGCCCGRARRDGRTARAGRCRETLGETRRGLSGRGAAAVQASAERVRTARRARQQGREGLRRAVRCRAARGNPCRPARGVVYGLRAP